MVSLRRLATQADMSAPVPLAIDGLFIDGLLAPLTDFHPTSFILAPAEW